MTPSVASLRAAAYLRQSLDLTEGVDRQRTRTHALIEARGWTFAADYVDNETSASKSRGPGTAWARMLDDLRAGRVDVVVAVDLDRLLRTTRDLNTLIDLGAKVVTVDGVIDLSTADGEFRATMLAGIARFEVRRKGERQKRANQQRAEAGRAPHSGRAYGYNLDGTIREDEAAVVRELFTRFVAGDGLHALAKWLHDAGHLNVRGTDQRAKGKPVHRGNWTRAGVRDLLTNRRYIAERWILRGSGKDRVREYVGPGAWEPIVTEELFRAAGVILDDPRRAAAGREGNVRKHWGAGCYRCRCGSLCRTAYGSILHKSGERVVYRKYLCIDNWCVSRRADYIDEYVEAVIIERLRDPRLVSALSAENSAEDARELRDQANSLRGWLDSYAAEAAELMLPAREVKVATERNRQRLADVEAHLARIGSTSALDEVLNATDPGMAWLQLGPEARASVANMLCTVTLHPQPRGRRPSDANPEKVAAWWKKVTSTVDIDWKHDVDAVGR